MEEICGECDFDQSRTPPREVPAALASLALAIDEAIQGIPDAEMRRIPTPGVWSALEYLGHLRESMAFHRWIIEHAVADDNPRIPMVDPDESVAESRYNEADCAQLVAQFNRRVQRLGDALSSMDDGAAVRTLTLGNRQLSVALVARSAWHELHHHLQDICGIARSGQPGAEQRT